MTPLTLSSSSSELELEALAAKEDEGVGSGYESDSESAVSGCTDDFRDDYLGQIYGESSDLEKETDSVSDSVAADSPRNPRANGREENVSQLPQFEEEGVMDLLTFDDGAAVYKNSERNAVALSPSAHLLPTVSLTPAGGSDSDMAREREMLRPVRESDREQDLFDPVDSATSGSPRMGLDLLELSDSVMQRPGSDSSDREDSGSSRSRWKNPFLNNSPTSESTLRPKRRTSERKESTASNSEKRGEDVPTFTLAIISRRSIYRAGEREWVVVGGL